MRSPGHPVNQLQNQTAALGSPARPLALSVPIEVKNIPLERFQLRRLCKKARLVFSPALKMYFAESNVTTTVGSVSDEEADKTVADQSIALVVNDLLRKGDCAHLRKKVMNARASLPEYDSRDGPKVI